MRLYQALSQWEAWHQKEMQYFFAKKNLVVLDYAVYTGEKTLFIHVLTHTFILLQDQRISVLFYAAASFIYIWCGGISRCKEAAAISVLTKSKSHSRPS